MASIHSLLFGEWLLGRREVYLFQEECKRIFPLQYENIFEKFFHVYSFEVTDLHLSVGLRKNHSPYLQEVWSPHSSHVLENHPHYPEHLD